MSQLTKYERAKAQIDRYRAKTEHVADVTLGGVVTVGGGFAAGVLDAKVGKVPNTNLDAAALVGIGGAAVALTGFAGKHSDHVGRFAFGTLAYLAGREGFKLAS